MDKDFYLYQKQKFTLITHIIKIQKTFLFFISQEIPQIKSS